jgi:hypothetical protein
MYKHFPQKFIIECWLLLLPLSIKVVLRYYNQLLMRISCGEGKLNEYQLLHRISVYQHQVKNNTPVDNLTKDQDLNHLLILGRNAGINSRKRFREAFNLLNSDHFISYLKLFLFEKCKSNPHFTLYKLFYIQILLKYSTSYLETAHLIRTNNTTKVSLPDRICLLLCSQEIQNILVDKAKLDANLSNLDLLKFIKLENGSIQLKEKINAQAKL